jgi:hypothetical protein
MRGKADTTRVILGYTRQELMDRLESQFVDGMTWGNYGNKRGCWSVDHIRPISTFPPDATAAEINSLSNLRPLWHGMNASKKFNRWEWD